jgi:ubiquinone biosynthesis protein COQ4
MATLATASMTDTATRGTNDLPFMLPGRPKMRYDFAKAWRHFRELVKDKENTAEVFPIFEALPWRGVYDARAFLSTERGQRIRASEPSLVTILDDHEALRRLPAGSVGQVYCDFMERGGCRRRGWSTNSKSTARPIRGSTIRSIGICVACAIRTI